MSSEGVDGSWKSKTSSGLSVAASRCENKKLTLTYETTRMHTHSFIIILAFMHGKHAPSFTHTCNLLEANISTYEMRFEGDILHVIGRMQPLYPPASFSKDYGSTVKSMYSNID